MSLEDQTALLDSILNEFREIVDKHFPNFIKDGYGYGGPHFHITLSGRAKSYEKTPYHFNDELKFVHWTSIENLVSIINNREIRLYNLINSEDEQEFEYSANELDLSGEQIQLIKENYFTFSFCKKKELNNKYLWETYGKKYSGVAIEFSIVNKFEDWETYLISNIYYDLPNSFRAYQDDLTRLKQKYGTAVKFEFDIWRLAGFHKNGYYSAENEVRISVCFPFKYYDERLKIARRQFRIDGKRNRIATYIPLQLFIDFEKPYPKEFYKDGELQQHITKELLGKPQIKIENIYFGCNCGLNSDEYYNFRNVLQEMISFQLGYTLEDLPLNLFDLNN